MRGCVQRHSRRLTSSRSGGSGVGFELLPSHCLLSHGVIDDAILPVSPSVRSANAWQGRKFGCD